MPVLDDLENGEDLFQLRNVSGPFRAIDDSNSLK
jgi:hypothetical protein